MIRSFSLIEAVLCIVVLGIILPAIPNLIFQSNKNNKAALMQQGVMDTKTILSLALNLPFDCAKNLTQTPIFAKDLDNFYDKNDIDVSIVQRRNFAIIDADNKCDKTSNLSKIEDINGLNFEAKNMNSNDVFITSNMSVSVMQKSINGVKNENVKEIKISDKIKSGNLNQHIIMRGYAVNIGTSPQILIKKW